MKTEEFIEKWKERNSLSNFHAIIFNGGVIFADHMQIREIKKIRHGKETSYEEALFSKNIGGLFVETGTCRIDKIKEVL